MSKMKKETVSMDVTGERETFETCECLISTSWILVVSRNAAKFAGPEGWLAPLLTNWIPGGSRNAATFAGPEGWLAPALSLSDGQPFASRARIQILCVFASRR